MSRIVFLICRRLRRPTPAETHSLDHTSSIVIIQITRYYPDHPFLCANKGSNLVGLKFMDNETSQHSIVEPGSVCGRRFKPTGDCAPSHPLDSSHRRDRNAVDTHVYDFIEQRSGLVQPIVRPTIGGGERSVALFTTVASPSALRCEVEGVADDVAFAELSLEAAIGVSTGASGLLLAPLHTCFMTEYDSEIQVGS